MSVCVCACAWRRLLVHKGHMGACMRDARARHACNCQGPLASTACPPAHLKVPKHHMDPGEAAGCQGCRLWLRERPLGAGSAAARARAWDPPTSHGCQTVHTCKA